MKREKYIDDKIEFIKNYASASNAASGSQVDANSNVEVINVATLAGEMHKKDNIKINRALMHEKLTKIYGIEMADQYLKDLADHIIYRHDETSTTPIYCAAITMYPLLIEGLKPLGCKSDAPQNMRSFTGASANLAFALSSTIAGAIALPEYLFFLEYFVRQEFGDDWYKHMDDVVKTTKRKTYTIKKEIEDVMQEFIFTINQVSGGRNYQSIFLNVAYFDEGYFNSIFDHFVFPDGSEPIWEGVFHIQKLFMNTLNDVRTRTVVTFPVETYSLLTDKDGNFLDERSYDLVTEMYAKGHSFFTYISDSPDALSSCCRLKSKIEEKQEFSFSLGAGGVSTGSMGVITLNMNRIIQDAVKEGMPIVEKIDTITKRVEKYLFAHYNVLCDFEDKGLLPIYDRGYINKKKQFLTLGVNSLADAAQFLGMEISDNEEYKSFVNSILETMTNSNNEARKETGCRFNIEMTPSENVAIKLNKWDKEAGYVTFRDCYSSYFYLPENHTDIFEKIRLHGDDYIKYLSGGSALHCNLEEHLTQEQYKAVLKEAAAKGCSYFTFNIPNSECNSCGHIEKRPLEECPICGSKDITQYTRVIGYLKAIKSFSEGRQKEASLRYYGNKKDLK